MATAPTATQGGYIARTPLGDVVYPAGLPIALKRRMDKARMMDRDPHVLTMPASYTVDHVRAAIAAILAEQGWPWTLEVTILSSQPASGQVRYYVRRLRSRRPDPARPPTNPTHVVASHADNFPTLPRRGNARHNWAEFVIGESAVYPDRTHQALYKSINAWRRGHGFEGRRFTIVKCEEGFRVTRVT